MNTKTSIVAYKGLDKDFSCRDFKFEVGKTYTHNGALKICKSGFHACTSPFDVWQYYGPGESRFALVNLEGDMSHNEGDSKIAAAKITITAELSLSSFVKAGVDWILANIKNSKKESNTGHQSAATNTGDQSAAEVSGQDSIALATGCDSKAKASNGSALVVCERNDKGKLLSIACGIAGENKIKPDTWYTAKNGKLVEIK